MIETHAISYAILAQKLKELKDDSVKDRSEAVVINTDDLIVVRTTGHVREIKMRRDQSIVSKDMQP